ncbi:MAG: hypothetical protein NXI24_06260 [bacterium]|nr:hypothetical protein [bacterium]
MFQKITGLYAGATALILSLSAGAMWAEAVVLVDFWRSMEPAAFVEWYRAYNPMLVAFYKPLQITATVMALALPIVIRLESGRWSPAALTTAVLGVAIIALFFIYFKAANAEFLSADPELAARIPALLESWSAWQWLRTGTGVASGIAGIAALRR